MELQIRNISRKGGRKLRHLWELQICGWGRRGAFRMMTLRFHRDKAGSVEAFDFNNPVLRNIKFTRQNDPSSGL